MPSRPMAIVAITAATVLGGGVAAMAVTSASEPDTPSTVDPTVDEVVDGSTTTDSLLDTTTSTEAPPATEAPAEEVPDDDVAEDPAPTEEADGTDDESVDGESIDDEEPTGPVNHGGAVSAAAHDKSGEGPHGHDVREVARDKGAVAPHTKGDRGKHDEGTDDDDAEETTGTDD